MKRAVSRAKLDQERNIELVESMWEQFHRLGGYEDHVIDTTEHSVEKTVLSIKEKIKEKSYLL